MCSDERCVLTSGQGYGLFLLGEDGVDEEALARGLAEAFGRPAHDIGVAAEDFDVDTRDWSRPVLCDYHRVDGDATWVLDLYATTEITDPPAARTIGRTLATALGRPVLYEASAPIFRPSAYWVATPDGHTGRARLYDPGDVDGRDGFVIHAAELPIPQLPHVPVDFIYEAIGDEAGNYYYGEALRTLVAALRNHCPDSTLDLQDPRDADADADCDDGDKVPAHGLTLRWTVPAERLKDCAAQAGRHLDAARPLPHPLNLALRAAAREPDEEP
ncbi:hypothetical protein FCH28_18125 [Streptomyces piniterrae]|uniref:Uncharacterized protein n=1 Tax=Streptomyces piniterrae TaxID=2571125 RepID=A0A4U0NG69_9ACTN|nr:hypothetical protein [Streptomyces piniterrae]TJZ53060.1 hypothetical protein FCH28_18125 [Streptomyces piniterrae]